jgi:hypothetical protein
MGKRKSEFSGNRALQKIKNKKIRGQQLLLMHAYT